jgi:hypothetical protein
LGAALDEKTQAMHLLETTRKSACKFVIIIVPVLAHAIAHHAEYAVQNQNLKTDQNDQVMELGRGAHKKEKKSRLSS